MMRTRVTALKMAVANAKRLPLLQKAAAEVLIEEAAEILADMAAEVVTLREKVRRLEGVQNGE